MATNTWARRLVTASGWAAALRSTPAVLAGGSLGLFVLAFALYWPYLNDSFALDDYIWLQAASNPHPADFFRRAFSFPPSTLFNSATPFWRPAVDTYFFAAWRTYHLHAAPYHVTNVAVHAANACLLAILVWQTTSSRVSGLLTAVLFVVLPTYDFAVTWISSITELLGTFFYLLTMTLYAAFLRRPAQARWLYGGAFAVLLLALLTKESVVTLPLALSGLVVAIDPPRSRLALRRSMLELTPFVALMLAYFVFLYVQEYRAGDDDGLYRFGWHGFENLWEYLRWIALPLPDDFAAWVGPARPWAGAAFIGLGCAALLLRSRPLGLPFVWVMAGLLPYSFFPAGIEWRYTYLASVPFAVFAVGVLGLALKPLAIRAGPPAATAALAAVVIAGSVFSAGQARDRQEMLAVQATAYEALFVQVPEVCGPLPRGSHIFVVSSPIFDLFGASSRMALNMHYDDVHVALGGLPDLVDFIESKCIVQYDWAAGGYLRVER